MSGRNAKDLALRALALAWQVVVAILATIFFFAAFALLWLATPPQCSAQADLDRDREARLVAAGAIDGFGGEVAE